MMTGLILEASERVKRCAQLDCFSLPLTIPFLLKSQYDVERANTTAASNAATYQLAW